MMKNVDQWELVSVFKNHENLKLFPMVNDLFGVDRPVWKEPITVRLHGDTLYTSPPPGAGALLAFILNILDGYNMTEDSMRTLSNMTTTVHRMVEAFKYAYARRTELGDPDFVDIKDVSDAVR
jgi:gamma-glutamyltranspeptidase